MVQKILAELSDIVGSGYAWDIVRRWSGGELYVPAEMTRDHPIALTVGFENAQRLSVKFGGGRIRIPLERNALIGERNKRILELRTKGVSYTCIARDFGLSRPGVVAICRRAKAAAEKSAA